MSTQDKVATAQQALADLRQEQADLPMLIQRAAEAGNTVMVRQLTQRQSVLQNPLSTAEESVLLAEIAVVDAKLAVRREPEIKAKQRFEELKRQRAEVSKALAVAEAEYNGLWLNAIGLGRQRDKLQAQLGVLRRQYIADILVPA